MANAHNKEHEAGYTHSERRKGALQDKLRTSLTGHQTHHQGVAPPAAPTIPNSASDLVQAIEGEIIPRLLLAHRISLDKAGDSNTVGQPRPVDAVAWPQKVEGAFVPGERGETVPLSATRSDVVAFAELLITFEPRIAKQFIQTQLSQGYAMSDLMLDLCAPAARELGDMWKRDVCSFCDVTIGLSTLEQVVLHFSEMGGELRGADDWARCALLTPMPGNQHVFGLLIVKELFRQAGWTVQGTAKPDSASILDAVRKRRFSVLGLSVGSVDDLQACQTLVKACRAESLNPKLLIMVGGHAIQEANMSTRLLDADLIARDGREGLLQIERMMTYIATQRPFN